MADGPIVAARARRSRTSGPAGRSELREDDRAGEHRHGPARRPPGQRPPAAAGPGHRPRPRQRARRRVPRRPAGAFRPRAGRAGPRRQGRARATGCSCSATTTSATRSSSSPTSRATRSSWPRRPRRGPDAPYIVFCGVHFMAESADILTSDRQTGGPARPGRRAARWPTWPRSPRSRTRWDDLVELGVADDVVPVTYMNSSAAIKAFTGRHGGTICTSATPGPRCSGPSTSAAARTATGKVLFLPDQHLGRNTAVRELGLSLDDCVVFDPHRPNGGLTREQVQRARMILWRGHCSVHGRFSRRRRRGRAPRDPRRQGDRAPRVPVRGRRGSPTRSARPRRSSRPSPRRRTARRGRSAPSSTSSGGWRASSPSSGSRSWRRTSATARR